MKIDKDYLISYFNTTYDNLTIKQYNGFKIVLNYYKVTIFYKNEIYNEFPILKKYFKLITKNIFLINKNKIYNIENNKCHIANTNSKIITKGYNYIFGRLLISEVDIRLDSHIYLFQNFLKYNFIKEINGQKVKLNIVIIDGNIKLVDSNFLDNLVNIKNSKQFDKFIKRKDVIDSILKMHKINLLKINI